MESKLEKEIWLENLTKYVLEDKDTDGLFEGNINLCNSCIYSTGICPDCGLYAKWADIDNRYMAIVCDMYEKNN